MKNFTKDADGMPRHIHSCKDCKPQHTPTPWTKSEVEFEKDEWSKLYFQKQICIGKGMDITAIVYGPDDQEEANAAFIVRAVNAHDALLRIVKELAEVPTIDETPGIAKGVFSEMDELIYEAREAIAKAEGR